MGSDASNISSFPPSVIAGDVDGDRLDAATELEIGSNPNDADTDDDGITDGVEFRGYGTSAVSPDSDGDGCGDDVEIASIDGNRVVNVIDLQLIASAIQSQSRPVPDIDKSRVVTAIDLQIAASNFAPSPC
jgi:hypothetical protein